MGTSLPLFQAPSVVQLGEGGRGARDDGKAFSLTSSDKEQKLQGMVSIKFHSNW